MREKSLNQILRFRRCVTAMTHKSIKRRPIRFTEIRQRFLRRAVRLSLAGAQDHRPMRRLKSCASFLQCSRYRFHWVDQPPFINRGSLAYQMPPTYEERDLRGKKRCGAICAGRKRGKTSRILREFTVR